MTGLPSFMLPLQRTLPERSVHQSLSSTDALTVQNDSKGALNEDLLSDRTLHKWYHSFLTPLWEKASSPLFTEEKPRALRDKLPCTGPQLVCDS